MTCHYCHIPITGKYGDVCLGCAIAPPAPTYTPSHCDDCGDAVGTITGWAEMPIGTDGRAFLCHPCADKHDAADLPAPPSLATIDRVADALLTGDGGAALDSLYPRDTPGKLDACMRALRILFPHTPDHKLAERLSAAYIATLGDSIMLRILAVSLAILACAPVAPATGTGSAARPVTLADARYAPTVARVLAPGASVRYLRVCRFSDTSAYRSNGAALGAQRGKRGAYYWRHSTGRVTFDGQTFTNRTRVSVIVAGWCG